MNEDHADKIIVLLEEIRDRLNELQYIASDTSSIASKINEAVDCLGKIEKNLS